MTTGFLPQLFNAADSLSRRSQSNYLWTIKLYYTALIAVPVAMVLRKVIELPDIAAATVVAFSIVVFRATFRLPNQRRWYRARALAESIKTISWQYAMKARPFDCRDPEALKALHGIFSRLKGDHKDVLPEIVGYLDSADVTKEMQRFRSLSWQERMSIYRRLRIKDQLEWYRAKAQDAQRFSKWWSMVVTAFSVAAMFGVFLIGHIGELHGLFVDVLVIASSCAFGWLQVKKYPELAEAYSFTAVEITGLLTVSESVENEADFAVFVEDSETAFSREHTQWRARRNAI
jgi:hypothetical protein